jgi:hypothetical protein
MDRRSSWLAPVACGLVSLLAFGPSPTARADTWQEAFLNPAVRSWMAVLTLVAEDGGRAESGLRGDSLGKLDEILGRLRRIESMLAARPMGPGGPPPGPPRGEWGPRGDGRGRDESRRPAAGMPPEMRKRMQARAAEARERWEKMSPEERAEMRKKMEARMEAARERMRDGGRRSLPEGEAHGKRPRGEQPRSPGDEPARRAERAPGPRPDGDPVRELMRVSRVRFAALQQRIERLEAELVRLKKELEEQDDD